MRSIRGLLQRSVAAVVVLVLPACAGASGHARQQGADAQSAIAATQATSEPARAEPAPAEPTWIALFNGRDLTGWTPKFSGHPAGENLFDTFGVRDGVLTVSFANWDTFDDRFGHLFYETPFSHYRLRAEYRFVGDQCAGGPGWAWRNNGLMLHGQSVESMGLEQDFPVSIEVQLLGGDGSGERPTANLCTPGTNVVMDGELVTRHCTNSTSRTIDGDAWVTVEVEVLGSQRIRHFVDGELVMEYTRPQLDPNDADAVALGLTDDLLLFGGTISIQAESHGTEFRRIELLPIDPGTGEAMGDETPWRLSTAPANPSPDGR